MARFLKYAGIVAAVFVGLLILVVALANLIPGEQYKKLISSGVKSETGREVVIEGDLDINSRMLQYWTDPDNIVPDQTYVSIIMKITFSKKHRFLFEIWNECPNSQGYQDYCINRVS